MSGTLIALVAAVAAIALIVGVIGISMRLTERMSSEALKRHKQDAIFYESNIGPGSGGGD